MRTLHISPRLGGSIELYELTDTPDGEPLGATLIGSAVRFENGFTHTKAKGRIFETQGRALLDLALTTYGLPDFVLDAMPELLGEDGYADALQKIYRSALAAEKAKERWSD